MRHPISPSKAFDVHAAKQAWINAHPITAMRILARAGLSSMQRRYLLISWGVSADDAIDYAADNYVADDAEAALLDTGNPHHAHEDGLHLPSVDGPDPSCDWCADDAEESEAPLSNTDWLRSMLEQFGHNGESGSASLFLLTSLTVVLAVVLPLAVRTLSALSASAGSL